MKPARSVWLGLLFAVCVARLWLTALPSSFWVDETVTAFVVERPHDPSLAAAPQVPASIYYWLPRIAVWLGGASEVVYRIPSVLAMLAAIWIVARLAARLIHPQAGWFAAFAQRKSVGGCGPSAAYVQPKKPKNRNEPTIARITCKRRSPRNMRHLE